jgi:hypothetical protein
MNLPMEGMREEEFQNFRLFNNSIYLEIDLLKTPVAA